MKGAFDMDSRDSFHVHVFAVFQFTAIPPVITLSEQLKHDHVIYSQIFTINIYHTKYIYIHVYTRLFGLLLYVNNYLCQHKLLPLIGYRIFWSKTDKKAFKTQPHIFLVQTFLGWKVEEHLDQRQKDRQNRRLRYGDIKSGQTTRMGQQCTPYRALATLVCTDDPENDSQQGSLRKLHGTIEDNLVFKISLKICKLDQFNKINHVLVYTKNI